MWENGITSELSEEFVKNMNKSEKNKEPKEARLNLIVEYEKRKKKLIDEYQMPKRKWN